MFTHGSSPLVTDQRREGEDGAPQLALATAHAGHRFDEGVTVAEAARRFAIHRSTFDRHIDELKALGLEEMPRLSPRSRRVFSARSIERVLHGESVRRQQRGR